MEIWGGLECSVVRLHHTWRDQLRETGHTSRDGDLEQVRGLGIQAVRYPVLWEHCAGPCAIGWDWHDAQMRRCADLGLRPIVGLLHHGSGPDGTDLLDPELAAGLAGHAALVVARYPEVIWWTPVNEPLTTARFSCLYGHWYPHLYDEGAFLRAVVHQCHAALLAMRAIRARQPAARFLHTEDIGRTFATPACARQAAYENDRRWLSLDLLCGRLDRDHPWRGHVEAAGAPTAVLDELATGEARPDLIGVNHYVTSDRFLDDRQALYPPHLRNPALGYVNTEAARVFLPEGETGWLARLREVWQRYGTAMVISEAHLGCADPQEQIRWLSQAWEAALQLRSEGGDIRAVTAWAMFGLVDWNSMLRERHGHYEPGVFDAAHAPPRPTLLATAIHQLAQHGRIDHPAVRGPGWWERDERVPAALRA